MAWLLILLLILLAPLESRAQQSFSNEVERSPVAVTPLNQADLVPLIQGGVLKQLSGVNLNVDLTGAVATTDRIDTTGCLTGGGDLSANRTLSIASNCISNSLLVPAPALTILANPTIGATNLIYATPAQVTGMLTPVAIAQQGVAPAIPPGTPGTAALLANGTWGNPTATISGNATITGGSISGVTLTGSTFGSGNIYNIPTPVNPTDPTSKAYVDALSTGAAQHTQVLAASTPAGLPNTPTYSNGTGGVGATLTAGVNAAFALDGQAGNLNGRYLVKDAATAAWNGIYTLTTLGGAVPWVLTRAADFNTAQPGNIAFGAFVFVGFGTVNAGTSWVMNTLGTLSVGSTALNWAQSSAAQTYTADGQSLQLIGSQFSVKSPLSPVFGGTGANNGSATITLSGNLSVGGAFPVALMATGNTTVTLPVSGTLLSSANTANCPDSGGNHLNTGVTGQLICGTTSATATPTFTLGNGLSSQIGTEGGVFQASGGSLALANFGTCRSGDYTIGTNGLADVNHTQIACGGLAITFTLPTPSTAPGTPGSPGVTYYFSDKAGFGFTLSSPVSYYGMPGVSTNSFTFPPQSQISVTSDGVNWAMYGNQGTIPDAQLRPVVSAGSCSNCAVTWDQFGRVTAASTGSGGSGGGMAPDTTALGVSAAGTAAGTATVLTAQRTFVTTAAGVCPLQGPYTTCNGVKLPSAGTIVTSGVGIDHAYVCGDGAANGFLVYPAASQTINTQAINVAVWVDGNSCAHFIVKSATAWRTVP